MANLNKVLLIGNLTRDPELRYTPGGTAVCQFGIAVRRSFPTREGERRDETAFVDVTMWGRRGVAISEYFSKGSPIFIEGRLKFDSWETADGRRSKLSVVAENFEFVGPRAREAGVPTPEDAARGSGPGGKGRPSRGGERAPAPQEPPPEEPDSEGFDISDDEIPF